MTCELNITYFPTKHLYFIGFSVTRVTDDKSVTGSCRVYRIPVYLFLSVSVYVSISEQ